MGFAAHYVGNLSQPLHNTPHDGFNKKNHSAMDGIIDGEILDNLGKIKLQYITIDSAETLVSEVARIANISL